MIINTTNLSIKTKYRYTYRK